MHICEAWPILRDRPAARSNSYLPRCPVFRGSLQTLGHIWTAPQRNTVRESAGNESVRSPLPGNQRSKLSPAGVSNDGQLALEPSFILR